MVHSSGSCWEKGVLLECLCMCLSKWNIVFKRLLFLVQENLTLVPSIHPNPSPAVPACNPVLSNASGTLSSVVILKWKYSSSVHQLKDTRSRFISTNSAKITSRDNRKMLIQTSPYGRQEFSMNFKAVFAALFHKHFSHIPQLFSQLSCGKLRNNKFKFLFSLWFIFGNSIAKST